MFVTRRLLYCRLVGVVCYDFVSLHGGYTLSPFTLHLSIIHIIALIILALFIIVRVKLMLKAEYCNDWLPIVRILIVKAWVLPLLMSFCQFFAAMAVCLPWLCLKQQTFSFIEMYGCSLEPLERVELTEVELMKDYCIHKKNIRKLWSSSSRGNSDGWHNSKQRKIQEKGNHNRHFVETSYQKSTSRRRQKDRAIKKTLAPQVTREITFNVNR